ncbi:hypothetical protein ACFPM3_17750 [Streptomyces coeruleoprunus]|uniref:CoF synthetase n=1 Tax=Streptomyces coeruleoprunus TaxID=285563 RepID=A0ABV9XFD1_9ACTN
MTTASAVSAPSGAPLSGHPAWGAEHAADIAALAARYAERFTWYGRLLDARGVRGSGRLRDLPVVDPGLLTEHYYTAEHPHLPDASAYHTSGTSTGRRKRILYSPADDDAYVAQRKALFQDFAGDLAAGSTAVADLGTGHAAASARRIFEEMGFLARDIDFQLPVEQHVERLNAWQPDVLFTMPMILDRLMRSPGLRIAPRRIMVVGDLAPENWRRRVAGHFGIGYGDVLDLFGSIEIGAIAHHNARTGLYHFHDHILPEVVPPQELYADEPGGTAGGGSGALLLTSFTRAYFPALRYVTGDMISGLRTLTVDGRTVYAFERIEGRLGGDFKHGERISNHDVCSAMAEVFPGAPFEVANDDGLRIRVVREHVTDEELTAVRRLLRAASPDVAQMIDSGLVGDIDVVAVPADAIRSDHAKRRFDVKEG